MRQRILTLTPAARAALEAARDHDHRPYLRERAAGLLKVADGWSAHQVAQRGLLKRRKPDTVIGWLDAYDRDGLAGLVQRPRGHRGFSPPQGAELVATVRQPPEACGLARTRWRLADLRAALPWLAAYSLSGISRALRRLEVGRQRGRLAVHSPDLAYTHKLAWLRRALDAARAPERDTVVLFGDEFSLHRQPTLGPCFVARGEEPVARLSHRSDTRYRYGGALNAVTGQLTWLGRSKMGVTNLKRLLVRLRRVYRRRRLVLVWDNWPIHQHPAVLETASRLGIELLWLPTYAPWTNPIEKLWRWLTADLLHHHRLADRWHALWDAVAAWLDQFAAPSPALLRYVGLSPV